MEAYRDQYATIFNGGNGVKVLAISTDDDTTQQNWAQEKSFPVTFLSNPDGDAGASYNVLRVPANPAARKSFSRTVFVVGRDGRITHVMRPFRELSAESYAELGEAVKKAAGGG